MYNYKIHLHKEPEGGYTVRDGRIVGNVRTGYRILRSRPETAPVLDPAVRLAKRLQRLVRRA